MSSLKSMEGWFDPTGSPKNTYLFTLIAIFQGTAQQLTAMLVFLLKEAIQQSIEKKSIMHSLHLN